MKIIKITEIEEPNADSVRIEQRKYAVRLGNGKKVLFSSMREAKAFTVATSDFLTDRLFDLNSVFTAMFVEYRRAWFYFDARGEQKRNEMIQAQREVQKLIKGITANFEVMQHGHYTRHNHQPFKQIGHALIMVANAAQIIGQLRAHRNEFIERKTCDRIAMDAKNIYDLLLDYGSKTNHVYEIINPLALDWDKFTIGIKFV